MYATNCLVRDSEKDSRQRSQRLRRRIDGSSYGVAENVRCLRGWFGRGRGDGREDFDGRRDERCVARGGPSGLSRKRLQDVYVAVRAAASRRGRGRKSAGKLWGIPGSERGLGHRGGTVHFGTGSKLSVVSVAHCWRTHESLGPHRAAIRSGRFSLLYTGFAGRGLADQLRRFGAVLRQSGRVHRCFRDEGKCIERAGRSVSAATEAAMHGTDCQEGLRQTEHYLHTLAAGDSYAFGERAFAVPLLRTVRTRVRDRFQFQLEPSADTAGDRYRQADADYRSDGARGFAGQGRQSGGRLLY